MKTAFTPNLKDNVATATLLAATFIAIMGSIVTSGDASASRVVPQAMDVQHMDTILITAPRLHQIARMETIVVTSSRETKVLVASI